MYYLERDPAAGAGETIRALEQLAGRLFSSDNEALPCLIAGQGGTVARERAYLALRDGGIFYLGVEDATLLDRYREYVLVGRRIKKSSNSPFLSLTTERKGLGDPGAEFRAIVKVAAGYRHLTVGLSEPLQNFTYEGEMPGFRRPHLEYKLLLLIPSFRAATGSPQHLAGRPRMLLKHPAGELGLIKNNDHWEVSMERPVTSSSVPVELHIGSALMSVEDLMALRPGDRIKMKIPQPLRAILRVGAANWAVLRVEAGPDELLLSVEELIGFEDAVATSVPVLR